MRQLILDDRGRTEFIRRIQEITLDGKRRYVGEFKVFRVQRSLKQNNLYWMWLSCIKAETGNDLDTLHLYFKNKYLPFEAKEIFGTPVMLRQSTTRLDTKQFTEYLENIRMEMLNDQAISLPQPGEEGWESFYTQYGIK
jgi:hypothetical protein